VRLGCAVRVVRGRRKEGRATVALGRVGRVRFAGKGEKMLGWTVLVLGCAGPRTRVSAHEV
jgi:hypothetical protein